MPSRKKTRNQIKNMLQKQNIEADLPVVNLEINHDQLLIKVFTGTKEKSALSFPIPIGCKLAYKSETIYNKSLFLIESDPKSLTTFHIYIHIRNNYEIVPLMCAGKFNSVENENIDRLIQPFSSKNGFFYSFENGLNATAN